MTDITVSSDMSNPTKVHVEDSGGLGRPVVLIHGWPLSGETFAGQVPVLRDAGYRVVTYDRRGCGRSDKPETGYDYDTLAQDLDGVLTDLDLMDVTLVGFSMGGGEVARYVSTFGEGRVHSVVFAAAVPPMMMKTPDNPEGPLEKAKADQMAEGLTTDSDAFYEQFVTDFYSADGKLVVTEEQRRELLALCHQASKDAALQAMGSFGTTDFREDLTKVGVPTLVLHGSADGVVPFEGSGKRTHEAIAHSELVLVHGAPHGFNVSHQADFNKALVDFLAR